MPGLNTTNMKKTMLIWTMVFLGTGLMAAQTQPDKNTLREEKATHAFEKTKALIGSAQFAFEADRLISSTGFSKSLVTTPNSIRINGDQADIYLPYYGELRANTPYQADGGIKYVGQVQEYEVEYRDHKRKAVIRFSIDRGIESHNFIMSVGKDGSTRVTVISGGRTSISYYGITRALEESTGF